MDPNVTCTAPDDDGEHVSDYEHVTGGIRPRSAALPLKKDYAFATTDLDDGAWPLVDAPHDFSIENGIFDPANDFKHGYLPRTTSWYRKHFKLPVEFEKDTSHLELHFQGAVCILSVERRTDSLSPSLVPARARVRARIRARALISARALPLALALTPASTLNLRLLSRLLDLAQRRVSGAPHRWLHWLHCPARQFERAPLAPE